MYTHDQILEISKENDDMRERLGAVGWLLDRLIAHMREAFLISHDSAQKELEDIYTVIHQPREKWPKIKGWE